MKKKKKIKYPSAVEIEPIIVMYQTQRTEPARGVHPTVDQISQLIIGRSWGRRVGAQSRGTAQDLRRSPTQI